MDKSDRAVVVLFRGDPRRDERQKRLPRRFLSTLHAAILKTIGEIAGVDVLIARDAGDEFRLGDRRWRLQSLSERIEVAVAHGFACGYARVLLLAGDIVGLRRGDIVHALQATGNSARTAAIGFSGDGGFYAAAFSQPPAVDWTRVLSDRRNAGAALNEALRADGFLIDELPAVDDVDTRADAERLIRLRRGSRAFLRLIARLASILRRVTAFAVLPQTAADPTLAFFCIFRGPPRSCRPS